MLVAKVDTNGERKNKSGKLAKADFIDEPDSRNQQRGFLNRMKNQNLTVWNIRTQKIITFAANSRLIQPTDVICRRLKGEVPQ